MMADLDAVFTVDEIADLLKYDDIDIRERRRRIYQLVRDGKLVPIGGRPNHRLTKSLRFTETAVRHLLELGAAA